ARHDFSARDSLLASFIHERASGDLTVGDAFAYSNPAMTSSIGLQLIHEAGTIRLLTGLAQATHRGDIETRFAFPGTPPITSATEDRLTQTDIYAYALFDPAPSVTITTGAAW